MKRKARTEAVSKQKPYLKEVKGGKTVLLRVKAPHASSFLHSNMKPNKFV